MVITYNVAQPTFGCNALKIPGLTTYEIYQYTASDITFYCRYMKKKTKKTLSKKSAPRKTSVSRSDIGFTPMGDRVIVKPVSPEEGQVTSFGIIIPDTAKEKPEQGTVVAVGPGKVGDDNVVVPVGVRVGDRIMFNKYGYDEIKINGVDYFIVSEANILGILN